MAIKLRTWRVALLAGCATVALGAALPAAASAEGPPRQFSITAQDLDSALRAFAMTSGHDVVFDPAVVKGRTTAGVTGAVSDEAALRQLLAGTNLAFEQTPSGGFVVRAPRFQTAADEQAGGSDGTVAALVVTAQKKEENIQDVPIAISAFTEKSLQEQKIEGGFDLLKAIPNVTFSKNNFSGYNFSIRGIGTKAISVTTDPGVAVEFNSTPLIRNRLFEQEYLDVERVEVLRGPQGTLHGRNATAGVINVISAKPDMDEFKGWVKGEVGNYSAKRLSAMVNVPLVDDKLAVRLAGAATVRDGYSINLFDNSRDDGRDLWTTRLTIGFSPTENVRSNLIWERFHEDDDRSRTSKQLCTPDAGPTKVGDRVIQEFFGTPLERQRGEYSQGCLPGSLYDDAAYGAPNGWALPFVQALTDPFIGSIGQTGTTNFVSQTALLTNADPYRGVAQSHDLRAIYSQLHPTYRAETDVLEFNLDIDVARNLTLTAQTGYSKDRIYSTQDYNRYTTFPVFSDSSSATFINNNTGEVEASPLKGVMPGGIFCDPQLGCSNTIVGEDLSRAKSTQFSQEVRLASDFGGPLNFVIGGNYLHYRTVEDYYVFNNAITLSAIVALNGSWYLGAPWSYTTTTDRYSTHPDCSYGVDFGRVCVPIENNPLSDIQDTGHNYFLSRNPYTLRSASAFGEAYWQVAPEIKITAGLRYSDDKKQFATIPSQLLLTSKDYPGLDWWRQNAGEEYVRQLTALAVYGSSSGYPVTAVETRRWRELTGKLGVEWHPDVSFTDQTLLYGAYSRGYKGGGMNPPRPGFNYDQAERVGMVYPPSAPAEFAPEFVDAFEVGTKNTFLGGAAVLNGAAFFYDYQGYQVSKIVERSAYNENFDAEVWGLELEGLFAPSQNLRLNGSLGFLDSALGNGSKSIDVMNRTAGHADWIVAKPAMTMPSNCIVPVWVAEMAGSAWESGSSKACPGGDLNGNTFTGMPPFGQTLSDGSTYNPADHPEANYGAGFFTDVSGHELPNSPHFTVSLGAQYSFDFLENWRGTIRADGYWQSQSWARVYELPIDKLHGWYNANLSVWVERPDDGLKMEFYVKNLLDETPITDAFINSDDSALTTNVFTLDPRLIGLSIKKEF